MCPRTAGAWKVQKARKSRGESGRRGKRACNQVSAELSGTLGPVPRQQVQGAAARFAAASHPTAILNGTPHHTHDRLQGTMELALGELAPGVLALIKREHKPTAAGRRCGVTPGASCHSGCWARQSRKSGCLHQQTASQGRRVHPCKAGAQLSGKPSRLSTAALPAR